MVINAKVFLIRSIDRLLGYLNNISLSSDVHMLLTRSPVEPQGVDQDGDPEHRRLGEVLQRQNHLSVRPRDLGGGTV